MKYNKIEGMNLAAVCLGTAPFGSDTDRETSFRLMDEYVECGGNFLDSASVYAEWLPGGKGMSESTIGEWMKSRNNRKKVFIGTKGGHPDLRDIVNSKRVNPECVRGDLEESLRRLQTGFIDIYWLHRDNPSKAVGEIVDMMNVFMKEGKIRHFACSNWKAGRIAEANRYAQASGKKGFIANQLWWSLAKYNDGSYPDPTLVLMDEREMEFHRKNNFPAAAYTPQAKGFFSEKYGRGKTPSAPSVESVIKMFYNETSFTRHERVRETAARKKKSMNQVALAYLLNHPFPSFAIVGPRTAEQLRDACGAAEISLTQQELEYLSGA